MEEEAEIERVRAAQAQYPGRRFTDAEFPASDKALFVDVRAAARRGVWAFPHFIIARGHTLRHAHSLLKRPCGFLRRRLLQVPRQLLGKGVAKLCASARVRHRRLVRRLYPHEAVPDACVALDDPGRSDIVVPGSLDEVAMASALLTVAAHPDGLLDRVLCTPDDDILEVGIVTARFCLDGQWTTVTTDTRTPHSTSGAGPLFGHCLDPSESWLQLLLKAWAKVRGCYEATHCGRSPLVGFHDEEAPGAPPVERVGGLARALVAVSGGVVDVVQLAGNARIAAQVAGDTLWAKLAGFHGRKRLPLAARIRWAEAGGAAEEGGGALSAAGLLRGLAYPVLYMKDLGRGIRLVKLRNAYGGARSLGGTPSEWRGDWSDGSDLWSDRPEVEAALIDDPDPRCDFERAQEGVFWMDWKDFSTVFHEVFVVRLPQPDAVCVQASGAWEGDSAAGPPVTTGAGQPVTHAEGGGDAEAGAAAGAGGEGKEEGKEGGWGEEDEDEEDEGASADTPVTPATGLPARPLGRMEVTGMFTVPDGDGAFFRNPQFRLTVPRVPLSAKAALAVTKAEAMAQSLGTSVDAVLDARAAGKSAGLLLQDARRGAAGGGRDGNSRPLALGALGPEAAKRAAAAAGRPASEVVAQGGLLGADGAPLHKAARIKKGSAKVVISLVQADGDAPPVPLRFLLLRRRRGERGRVWELRPGDVVADSAAGKFAPASWTTGTPGRAATLSAVWLDPSHSYVLIPFTAGARVEAPFLLRVVAAGSDVTLRPVPPPASATVTGRWAADGNTVGGALHLPTVPTLPEHVLGAAATAAAQGFVNGSVTLRRLCRPNPRWALNPQFVVTLLASPSAAGATGGAAAGSGRAAPARSPSPPSSPGSTAAPRRTLGAALAAVGAGGAALPTQRTVTLKLVLRRTDRGAGRDGKEVAGAVLRNTTGLYITRAPLSAEGREALEAAASRRRGSARGRSRGRSRGGAAPVIPAVTWDKRAQVEPTDFCQVSSFRSETTATAVVRVPENWLDGAQGAALLVTPTLLWPAREGAFSLTVHSNAARPLGVSELVSPHSAVLPGAWVKGKSAVGSHLAPEWGRNPAFEITPPPGAERIKVRVTLTRPAAVWAAAQREDAVAAMIGFYVVTCAEDKAARYNDGRAGLLFETQFVPGNSVSGDFEVNCTAAALRHKRLLLLPATFEAGQAGPFTVEVAGSLPLHVAPFVAPPAEAAAPAP